MIDSVLALFEKIATNAHYVALDSMVDTQALDVQQAINQQDSYALQSLFCNPAELANKTTVFQS